MSSDDDDDMEYKYDVQGEGSKAGTTPSIPAQSQYKYNRVYEDFQKWNKLNGDAQVTQNILLKYFTEMIDQKKKPTTMWAYYSMLKSTLRLHANIDITPWSKLLDFLKRKSAGYKPSTPALFTENELETFMNEAPDEKWLDVKVAVIFSLNGARSGQKLCSIQVDHIKEYENYYWVLMPNAEIKQSFTITGAFYDIVKQYLSMRPKKIYTNRFFLHCTDGKCTANPMGHNHIYKMARRIAQYLKLPRPEQYAGNSFRIPTATELVARLSIRTNPPKIWKTEKTKTTLKISNVDTTATKMSYTEASNSSSAADPFDERDFEEQIDQSTELDYETGLLKTPSVSFGTSSASVARNSNDINTLDHICTKNCSLVKCAKEDNNEKNVFHAFSITKSSDYAITEVIPVQFPTDPTCRWMVAYSHFNNPVSPHNWDEAFDEITKQIPKNVRVLQKYIRCSSSKLFAAYVVVYGVKCQCQKPIFGPMAEKADTFRKRKIDPFSEQRQSPAVFRKPNFDPLDSEQPEQSPHLDDLQFIAVDHIKEEVM